MKYVFFGSPRFAQIIFEEFKAAGIPPIALVCNPDRPFGRKKIITPPPTKTLADGFNIRVLQPEKLDDAFAEELRSIGADIFVIAAYSKIIPKKILEIARLGSIGMHPSLLPKYRGASPIQSAIIGNETETGVSLYLMNEKMDNGPILAQEKIPLDPLAIDYLSLEERLAKLGADLFIKTFAPDSTKDFDATFLEIKNNARKQDESEATYTKKFSTQDGFVNKEELEATQGNGIPDHEGSNPEAAGMIVRKINALTPEPGVWTIEGDKRIKLLKATLENGILKLLLIQKEGEKPKEPASRRL